MATHVLAVSSTSLAISTTTWWTCLSDGCHMMRHTAGQSATEYSRPWEVTHTPPAGHTAADTSAAILLALQEIKRETKEIREDSRQLQREVQFLMQQHQSTPPRSPAREVTTRVDQVTSTPHQRSAPQHSSPLIAELSEQVRSMNLSKGQLPSPSSGVTPEYVMPYSPRHPSVAQRQQPVFPSSADLSSQFCGHITVTSDPAVPDAGNFSLYPELLEATRRSSDTDGKRPKPVERRQMVPILTDEMRRYEANPNRAQCLSVVQNIIR
ncbi:unnamed protein product [Menidia menidia]|uniref:(Atlantic silverside) hypothetical protein n=1 Tax=Menidia menidia TaxID=238744 RepID=A0A8S4AUP3_9TELE|nr:unnamed protein product [Menidia menidia]